MAPIQGSVRRRAGGAEAEPFFEDVKFAEDVAAGQFDGHGAEEQERGIEEEDARQQNRMPVADLLHGARVHVHGGLARVEHGDQGDEERHVSGESAEDECAGAIEDIARAAVAHHASRHRHRRLRRRWAGGQRVACLRCRGLCARPQTGWE